MRMQQRKDDANALADFLAAEYLQSAAKMRMQQRKDDANALADLPVTGIYVEKILIWVSYHNSSIFLHIL
jgi:hypothetical protein